MLFYFPWQWIAMTSPELTLLRNNLKVSLQCAWKAVPEIFHPLYAECQKQLEEASADVTFVSHILVTVLHVSCSTRPVLCHIP